MENDVMKRYSYKNLGFKFLLETVPSIIIDCGIALFILRE